MTIDVETKPKKKPWIQRITQDAGQWIAGWANPLTGQGDPQKDKSAAAYWSEGVLLQPVSIASLFTFNALARAICCALPEWALRNGWDLTTDRDAVQSQSIESAVRAKLDELDAHEKSIRAAVWGQAFGGGLLLIGADDGREGEEPIDEENLQGIRWLRVVPRHRAVAVLAYSDTADVAFGQPAVYEVREVGANGEWVRTRYHESRVIRFPGPITDDDLRMRNLGWDQSILDVVISALRKHDGMWDDVGAMTKDGSQGIWKISGLANAATTGLIEHVQARIQAAELVRSVFGALMLDAKEEDFTFVSREFGGISDLLGQSAVRTAGAAQMPVTVLMGQSPAGLNATGESDLEIWYARCEAWGNSVARSRLERLVQLVLCSKEGPTKGVEPETWAVKLRDPRKLSPMQRKEIEARQSQIDAAMIASKVYTPEEVAISRYTSEGWSDVMAIEAGWRRKSIARASALIEEQGNVLIDRMLQRWFALTPEGAQPGGRPAADSAAPVKEPSGEMAPQDVNKRLVSGSPGRSDALRAGGSEAETLGLRFDAHDGVMVAMKLPLAVAEQLALEGGEPVEQLHVTLAYLGKTGVLSAGVLERAGVVVRAFAEQARPLEARVAGIGRFTASGGSNLDVLVALVDAPGLGAMRAGLVELLDRAGVPASKAHDFMPHVTLAYLPRTEAWAVPEAPSVAWVMGAVSWYVGGKRRRYALEGKAD